MLIATNRVTEAEKQIELLLGSEDSSCETKVTAVLFQEKLHFRDLVVGAKYGLRSSVVDVELKLAHRLKGLTARGPEQLRALAALAMKAAELHALTDIDSDLSLNWKLNQERDDAFWRLMLAQRRWQVERLVIRKFSQCLRLLEWAFAHEHYHIIPAACSRIERAMLPLMIRLWQEELYDSADLYRNRLSDLCHFAAELALKLRQWSDVALVSSPTLAIDFRKGAICEERAASLRSLILRIEDEVERAGSLELFDFQLASLREALSEEPPLDPTIEEAEQMYRDMARGLGLNIDAPNDRISQIVAFGIKDLNPERVLRPCCHLYTTVEANGVPAQMLRLPTAGIKGLYCTKHRRGMAGPSLDDLSEVFQTDHCDGCPDRAPHPPDWQWSHEWQHEQDSMWRERMVSPFRQNPADS